MMSSTYWVIIPFTLYRNSIVSNVYIIGFMFIYFWLLSNRILRLSVTCCSVIYWTIIISGYAASANGTILILWITVWTNVHIYCRKETCCVINCITLLVTYKYTYFLRRLGKVSLIFILLGEEVCDSPILLDDSEGAFWGLCVSQMHVIREKYLNGWWHDVKKSVYYASCMSGDLMCD